MPQRHTPLVDYGRSQVWGGDTKKLAGELLHLLSGHPPDFPKDHQVPRDLEPGFLWSSQRDSSVRPDEHKTSTAKQ